MAFIEISNPETSPVRRALPEKHTACRRIQEVVAKRLNVPLDDLRRPSRGSARAAFARQVAMYLAHITLGLNYSEIGRLFQRDRTTVAHACEVVEDQRDQARVDALVQTLENALAKRGRP